MSVLVASTALVIAGAVERLHDRSIVLMTRQPMR